MNLNSHDPSDRSVYSSEFICIVASDSGKRGVTSALPAMLGAPVPPLAGESPHPVKNKNAVTNKIEIMKIFFMFDSCLKNY